MGRRGLHGPRPHSAVSSFACAIPGIIGTRVIDNRRDRLTTILIAPLMTCSARIPVYTLIISAFIPAKADLGAGSICRGLVMFGLYTAGIAAHWRCPRHQFFHAARLRAGTFHAGVAGLQDATRRSDRHRRLYPGEDVPAAGGTTIFSIDGADLVSGVVPVACARSNRSPDRTNSFAAMIGKDAGNRCSGRSDSTADRRGIDPGHGGAGSRGRRPSAPSMPSRAARSADQIGQMLATK